MRRARGWVFGVGLAAALGFGGAQAVAAPAAAHDEARACSPAGCDRSCKAQGGISGRCTDAGLCACFW